MNAEEESKAMPPPPDPSPQTTILVAEADHLTRCLKNAVVKTGQIYGFSADTYKLGIQVHAPSPPRTLTAALGREVENFDQLCDSIESNLLRAITVLQRDLRRARDRLKTAEASKSLAEHEVIAMPPPQTPISPTPSTSGLSRQPTDLSPSELKSPISSTSAFPARRPSAISISSLHRPAFPLKLDLSTTSLRAATQESSLFSNGLASPVTLAPKSARAMGPNEFPPELMAAFATASAMDNRPVDIDLTIPPMDVEPSKGDSSDKPIELDLDDIEMDIDMSDLFGDPTDTNSPEMRASVDNLFSPVDGDGEGAPPTIQAASSKEGDNFLNQFGVSEDMFASLDSNMHANDNPMPSQPPTSPIPSSSSAARPTSPRSLANNFSSSSEISAIGQVGPTELPAEATFDLNSLDLSNLSPGFFATAPESELNFPTDMEDFLHMGDDNEGKPEIY